MREKLQGYVTAVNPILPRRARKRARQPPLHVLEILGAHDLVPIEHRLRLVARLAITFLEGLLLLREQFLGLGELGGGAGPDDCQAGRAGHDAD